MGRPFLFKGERMAYPRLAERLYNVPLLVMPEKAEVIERVFHTYSSGGAVTAGTPGETAEQHKAREQAELAALLVPARRTDGGYALTERGVAILSMYGTLVQRAGGLDALSGLTGYNMVMSRLDAALRDPLVRGVVLDVDSPGGEVAGAFELASFIADAAKPIYAVANELAASAAYLVASAADRLYAPKSGQVGSIGVVMLHQDRSAVIEKSGVRYTPIYAGAKKLDGSSLTPLSESARLDLQQRVDDVYSMFVDAVANQRGIDADLVRSTEAGMLSAQQALEDGFVDEIGSLTNAIIAMQEKVFSVGFSFTKRAARATKESSMSKESVAASAPVNAHEIETQLAAARAEGATQGIAQATVAERERIKAILGSDEAMGRQTLAAHLAYETALTPEAAVAMLAKAGREVREGAVAAAVPPNLLAAAMKGMANPSVGPDAESGQDPAKARIDSASIFAMRRQAADKYAR